MARKTIFFHGFTCSKPNPKWRFSILFPHLPLFPPFPLLLSDEIAFSSSSPLSFTFPRGRSLPFSSSSRTKSYFWTPKKVHGIFLLPRPTPLSLVFFISLFPVREGRRVDGSNLPQLAHPFGSPKKERYEKSGLMVRPPFFVPLLVIVLPPLQCSGTWWYPWREWGAAASLFSLFFPPPLLINLFHIPLLFCGRRRCPRGGKRHKNF